MLEFLNVGYLTGVICTSFSLQGNYVPACNKAIEATVIQTGIARNVDRVKSYYTDKAKEMVKKRVQVSATTLIVGSVVYETVVQREIHITFRAKPISDSMSVQANLNTVSVGLAWAF